MSDDEDVKKEVKEDHINIKVRDMVRPVSYTHLTLPTICSV